MPSIDLKPHEYTRPDPKSGKRVRDFSPKFMRNMTFLAIVMLVVIWWTRNEGSRDSLFGITAFVAACGGVMAANWLKDIY